MQKLAVYWAYRRPLDASSLAEGSVRTSSAGDQVSLKSQLATAPSGPANCGVSPRVHLRRGVCRLRGNRRDDTLPGFQGVVPLG
jgi:hypothetical protein